MKWWNFVHKSDNRKDMSLVHTKVLKCFIHFPPRLQSKKLHKTILIGQQSKVDED